MSRSCYWIAIYLIFSCAVVGNSFAETVFVNKNLKLKSVAIQDDGVAFVLSLKADQTPGCQNQFIVLNDHPSYNLMAAALLTASASKKKIGVEFDDSYPSCPMEATLIELY